MLRLALLIALLAACGDEDPALEQGPVGPPAGFDQLQWGEQLYQTRGCVACHRIDSGAAVGPALNGIVGERRALPDGRSVIVDADYLQEALVAPSEVIVPGYEDVMPAYDELLAPAEREALVAYLQSLSVPRR